MSRSEYRSLSQPADLPLYITPFVGWRLWTVLPDSGELASLMSLTHWPLSRPLVSIGTCHDHFPYIYPFRCPTCPQNGWCYSHGSPHGVEFLRFADKFGAEEDEDIYAPYGIHAWKEVGPLVDYLQHAPFYIYESSYHSRVIGQVWLWGRVEERELGYRATCAYPKSVLAVNGPREILTDIERLYGLTESDFQEAAGHPDTIQLWRRLPRGWTAHVS